MYVLGLDLGVGSIGWCIIETDNQRNPLRIAAIGSRILSLTPEETAYFERGRGETVCSARTAKRTARKGNYRYKMRRALLNSTLAGLGMLQNDNHELIELGPLDLWKLRADAATPGHRLSLSEIGRVLQHLNQKRGYRHAKTDGNDSKQTQYVQQVNARLAVLHDLNMTVGQYQYSKLKDSQTETGHGAEIVTHRVKDNVYPRNAYREEFDRIMAVQSEFHPDVLTPTVIESLGEIIFHQRPLKSCKHLVSICDFEKRSYTDKNGKVVEGGPKVAPRTSPLAQVARLWEAINNIRLTNSKNRRNKSLKSLQPSLFDDYPMPRDARMLMPEYELNQEERLRVFEHLNTHEKLTVTDLFKILGIKKSDGFVADAATSKGIKGNDTYVKISEAIGDSLDENEKRNLLQFKLEITTIDHINKETGEVTIETQVNPGFEKQPLYKLWHMLYSISDKEELSKALGKNYGFEDPEQIERLCSIDFVTPGFSNRSARFMRRIIPYLMQGYMYSEACDMAGFNHSNSLTKEQNEARELKPRLELLAKNSLRQPLVEKILNQMINVVNALIDRFGAIDEARVELARELKQSKDERIKATQDIGKREKENAVIAAKIEEYGLVASRSRIQKYRMWQETGHICMYCGQPVGVKEFLSGDGVEVEHIIPRTMYFDNSLSNKTCACRECNREKNNRTANDYMASKGDEEYAKYQERVDRLYSEKKISGRKHRYLLMKQENIPSDFIERDLRQSQYISKKAISILREAIRDVWASSGNVTDFFRHAWGYDRILHDLNIDRYALAGLVHEETFEHKGQTHSRPQIEGWNKRLDHGHHAIDALTIALTRQGYIQRLNNLTSEHGNLHDDIVNLGAEFRRQHSLLNQWAETRPHFTVAEVADAVDGIAVSFKAGKKLATPATRSIVRNRKRTKVQKGILVPRGALHEESIYGKIKVADGEKSLKHAFENPDLVINRHLRAEIKRRMEEAGGDWNKAYKSVGKKNPLTIMRSGEKVAVEKVNCWKEEFVIKYTLDSIKLKNVNDIVDKRVRDAVRARYAECGDSESEYKKSLAERPLTLDGIGAQVRTVRCFTGLNPDSMVTIRKDGNDIGIGYSKTGNNHHVAFYEDEKGKVQPLVTSFWDGILRRLNGIPAIVINPATAWDALMNVADEEVREKIAAKLPAPGWRHLIDMQRNEMFILGMSEEEYRDAVNSDDKKSLSRHLYRVQKLSSQIIYFRLQTSTNVDEAEKDFKMLSFYRTSSYKGLMSLNPHKVRVTLLGEIIYD